MRQLLLHRQLTSTMHRIWQGYAAAEKAARLDGDETAALEAGKLQAKWELAWARLRNCQYEWIGFYADCCKGASQPVAVPIGCNHRLCPLCAWHRSKKARKRIKSMFDRLTHPALITLTIPNKATIRKHDYTLFRQRVRKLLAMHKGWIRGGVYALETTYNRAEKTWHIHAHILADLSKPLPKKGEWYTLAGKRVSAFRAVKLKLEFDWMRLWLSGWGKPARKNASKMEREGDTFTFEGWVKASRANRLREWRNGGYQPVAGLSQFEMDARREWNRRNRRVIDIRTVLDRDGAAREVLKYITKVADFCDVPEAVEPFCDAVKGARLIQTFGTWYGVKLDEPCDANHPEDWGEMKCACTLNMWRRMGVFYRRDVEMDRDGRWLLRRPLEWNSPGTVPRPTIRALDERDE